MSYPVQKSIPLFVGWLSVIVGIAAPLYYVYLLMLQKKRMEEAENVADEMDKEELMRSHIIVFGGSVLWLILSLFLIKGIKQNRPALMLPWMLMFSLAIAASCTAVFGVFMTYYGLGGSIMMGLLQCAPMIVVLVTMVICLFMVGKLCKSLSTPPPVLPTQYVMEMKKPEEQNSHYMPVFENC